MPVIYSPFITPEKNAATPAESILNNAANSWKKNLYELASVRQQQFP
jgi:hypothetical protein